MACLDRARIVGGYRRMCRIALVLFGLLAWPGLLAAQEPAPARAQVDRQRDRGEGVSTSMFGTYVRKGELLFYPFFEHYRDGNFEYTPAELGSAGERDYRGRYRANEGLVLLSYGVNERVAVEFEMAYIGARLDKAIDDTSPLAGRTAESGLGDVEGQIRWRWNRESDRRPEIFSYAEVVAPHHREKVLIGTSGWQLKYGTGFVRGFAFGTLTARAAVEYDEASSSHFDAGEYAVEYLRRLSPKWRVFAGLEGKTDEATLIGEVQWHATPRMFFKFNNGVGLTSKAAGWAPEIGVVFSFGRAP